MFVLLTKDQREKYFSEDDIVRQSGNDFILCPFHADHNPSLSINLEDKCFHCFGCKASGVILPQEEYERQKFERNNKSYVTATNVDVTDWGEDDFIDSLETPDDEQKGKPTENRTIVEQREHLYSDEQGNPVKKKFIIKYSDGSKDVRQQYYDRVRKNWVYYKPKDNNGKPLTEDVLYNLDGVLKSAKGIIFVEGEKDVDTLRKMEIHCVTTTGSSSDRLKPEHFKYFKDKTVFLIPDEDEAGYKYVREIAKTLYLNKICEAVYISFLPDARKGSGMDISDWISLNAPKQIEIGAMIKQQGVLFENAQEKLAKYDGNNVLTFEEEMSVNKDFPLEDMPKVVRDYVRIKSYLTNTSEEYHCMGILAGIGSLAAAKYELQTYDKWKSNTTLCIVLVGTTGQTKSHPLSESLSRILKYSCDYEENYKKDEKQYKRSLDNRKKQSHTFSGGEDIEKPLYQPYVINKFTLEGLRGALVDNPKGVLLYVDELRGMFNSLNQYKGKGDDVEVTIMLIDGRSINIKLASESFFLKNPKISIAGTIQPDILKKCFDRETKDNGLAFRFLFCCPDKKYYQLKKLNERLIAISEKASSELDKLFDAINEEILILNDDGSADPRKVYFDDKSEDIFLSFINDYCVRLAKTYGDKDNLVEAIIAKIRTYFPKLALLIQLMRYHSGETDQINIEEKSMQITKKLVKYFIYHNNLALGTTGNDDMDFHHRKLKEYCTQREIKTIKLRDVLTSKIWGRGIKMDVVRSIAKQLAGVGKISLRRDGKTEIIDLPNC